MADSKNNATHEIEGLLSEKHKVLPKITRSSHDGTISVKNNFYLMPPFKGKVIVTVKATYKKWVDFESNPENVTFCSIPFSKKTAKKTLLLLNDHFENHPELFKLTFFSEFAFQAIFHNPKHQYGKKSRGKEAYFAKCDLPEAKISAIHLFVFIKYWSEQRSEEHSTQLPEEYKRIEELSAGTINPREIPFCVMKLLDDYYGTSLLEPLNNGDQGSKETERQRIFMKNYIYSGKKWRSVEKLYGKYGYRPLKISDAAINKEDADPLSVYHPLYRPLLRVIL